MLEVVGKAFLHSTIIIVLPFEDEVVEVDDPALIVVPDLLHLVLGKVAMEVRTDPYISL